VLLLSCDCAGAKLLAILPVTCCCPPFLLLNCFGLLTSCVLILLQALVSVSTIGTLDSLSDQELIDGVKAELGGWFGASEVAGWQHLKTYRIPFAQPNQVRVGGS
jgi:hypothetical protein